jgi:drug/metabolite transporter (DMT)-like permease
MDTIDSPRGLKQPAKPSGFDNKPNARTTLFGIGMVVLTSAMWTASDGAAQWLTRTLPPLEVTWVRYVVHVLVLFPWLRGGFRTALRTQHLKFQVLRGVFSAFSAITFIIGLNLIPIAEATSITFVAPFVIMGLAALLLHEKVELRRWLAAGVGLAGVLVIVQPGGDAFHWSALLPLLAAILGASAIVTTRLMPHDDAKVTMVYTGFVGLIVLSVLVPFQWVTPSSTDMIVGAAVGVFGAAANLIQITVYRQLPASLLAPFSYSQLVWASLFGFAVFGVWPTFTTLSGAAIIAVSGLYSAWRERQAASAGPSA